MIARSLRQVACASALMYSSAAGLPGVAAVAPQWARSCVGHVGGTAPFSSGPHNDDSAEAAALANASEERLKGALRKLYRRVHPDLFADDEVARVSMGDMHEPTPCTKTMFTKRVHMHGWSYGKQAPGHSIIFLA